MEENILVEAKFEEHKKDAMMFFAFSILFVIPCFVWFSWLSLIGIPVCIINLYKGYQILNVQNQKLVITNKSIYGKTLKEEFNLSINKITTVNLQKNNELIIVVPSKKLKFIGATDSEKVYKILVDITKNNTSCDTVFHNSTSSSNAKAIKEYKELLDMGAITQEEFDAKKKELLNL